MNLIVNEIFYSLQGEGGRSGSPSIFVRLAKCNLSCEFCDTDFQSGKEMSIDEILEEISKYPCQWIVWTGGEPTLQLTERILLEFNQRGYKQAIETNGTRPIPNMIDYVACSPKINLEATKKIILQVDEIRIPIKKGDLLPELDSLPLANNYFVSPIFDGNKINEGNLRYCINLVKASPTWSLSIQLHKLINIP